MPSGTPCDRSENADEKNHTSHSDGSTSQSHRERTVMLARLADQKAGADPGKVQQGCRDHEAGSISDAAGILRNFGSMGVTVKNSKQADDTHYRHGRRFEVKRNDCTEYYNRNSYADFDKGNPDAGDAERAGDSHDGDEGRRNEPKRAAAELPREDADHHHGKDVIEARNRMPKPMDKAARIADPRVGKGNRRRKDRRCRREP